MYILSKTIYHFINPLNWILLLLVVAVFWPKWRMLALRLGLGLLLLFTWPPLILWLGTAWEVPLTAIDDAPPKEVAIVLGGFAKVDGSPADRLHLTDAATRLTTTLELYQAGKVKRILLSGGLFRQREGVRSESDQAADFLVTMGVPRDHIFIERQALNTEQNASYSRALLLELYEGNLPDAYVVTSAWHMRRSLRCFERARYYVTPFSTDPLAVRLPTSLLQGLAPQPSALGVWKLMIKEWVGYVKLWIG